MAKKKQEKVKVFKYFGLNIKLLSNSRSGDLAYFQLVKDLFDKDVIVGVGGEKAVTLRTQFLKKIVWNNVEYQILYGKLTRFTLLESEGWYNQKKKEIENYQVPLDLFPNGFETEYCFIPAAHRFFIKIDPKVGLSAVERFLQDGIRQVAAADEMHSVHLMLSEDSIEKILSAPELKFLKIDVSYTNDDIGKEAQELIDDLLKEGQIGDFSATIKPDQNGTLDQNSNLVKGLLEISRENGTAEATIKNNEGKREKIKTHQYPEKITVSDINEDNMISKLFFLIMGKYRNG